jgi:hypothetical protein
MALTREMLKGMALTEEQVSAIISEHVNVTSALKEQIKEYKTQAELLPAVQKELDDLKKSGGDWQDKYNKEHKDFEQYKQDIAAKEAESKVKSAYSALLKENGIGDKYIDSILRVTDFSKMELEKEGKLKGADQLSEEIKSDYSGFIVSTETHGAGTETPPADPNSMTKEAFEKLSLAERMSYANEHPGEVSNLLK